VLADAKLAVPALVSSAGRRPEGAARNRQYAIAQDRVGEGISAGGLTGKPSVVPLPVLLKIPA
jgi:hypothetical protein